jgi:hypothetical protein
MFDLSGKIAVIRMAFPAMAGESLPLDLMSATGNVLDADPSGQVPGGKLRLPLGA